MARTKAAIQRPTTGVLAPASSKRNRFLDDLRLRVERDGMKKVAPGRIMGELYHDKMRRLHTAAKIALEPLFAAVSERFSKLADTYPGSAPDEDTVDDRLAETMTLIERMESTFTEPYFPDEDYLWVQEGADLINENGQYLVEPDLALFAYEVLTEFVFAFEERFPSFVWK